MKVEVYKLVEIEVHAVRIEELKLKYLMMFMKNVRSICSMMIVNLIY